AWLNPRFAPRRRTRAAACSAASAAPSCEPLSTARISATAYVWPRSFSSRRTSNSRPFHTGIMTVTIVLKASQKAKVKRQKFRPAERFAAPGEAPPAPPPEPSDPPSRAHTGQRNPPRGSELFPFDLLLMRTSSLSETTDFETHPATGSA